MSGLIDLEQQGAVDVNGLAQIIRQVDGNHTLGASALAEAILSRAPSIAARQPVGQEAAYEMGAKGAPATEAERLLFEAWMRGHCWALSATWDGKTYLSDAEQGGMLCPRAMTTRRLWAAWRDRAALTAPPAQAVDAWDRIVEACVITEAVTPDPDDVGGTLRRLIDYYVGVERDSVDLEQFRDAVITARAVHQQDADNWRGRKRESQYLGYVAEADRLLTLIDQQAGGVK